SAKDAEAGNRDGAMLPPGTCMPPTEEMECATLTPEAWARIEIAKRTAGERLRKELATLRAAPLQGLDEEVYFQIPLCFAYADYVRDIFCAQLAQYLKDPGSPSTLPRF